MKTLNPKFYKVGGYVRDLIRGVPSHDIDWVVVGANPEWMNANGYQQVGAAFPVFLDANGTEFALARTETKAGNGYHAFFVDYSSDITLENDLSRRDLTINAIALESGNKEFIDPFGGITDIREKRLRHVSDSFRDDPVRVLRLARFMAQFGPEWHVDASTDYLCEAMVESGELKHLTKERIWKEFEKALNTPNTHLFLQTLKNVKALKVVFPLLHNYYDPIMEILKENDSSEQTAITRFTLIMTMFQESTISVFCGDYRVPNEYKEYAVFHSKLAHIPLVSYNSFSTLVAIMNDRGIYRNNAYMLNKPWKTPYISILKCAYEKSKHINFNSLTDEEKANYHGRDISRAIDIHRSRAIEQ